MKEKSPNQIIRFDGRNRFVEVINSSFPIGKVEFRFRTYDLSLPKKSRFTGQVDYYLNFPVFLEFAHDAMSGRCKAVLAKAKEQKQNARAFFDQGGTSARSLAGQGRERADRMCEARQFMLIAGNSGYLLEAESGPGEENKTGLIVPKYGKKYDRRPDVQIAIPLNDRQLKQLILTVEANLNAYLAAKYVYAEGERRKQEKVAQQQQNAGYPSV